MSIDRTGGGRIYIKQIGDVDEVGKTHQLKGIKKHFRGVGKILSLFNLAFYDKEGGWINKKSTIHYLQRNSGQFKSLNFKEQGNIANLDDSSQAAEVKRLFQLVKNLKTKNIEEPSVSSSSIEPNKDVVKAKPILETHAIYNGITTVRVPFNKETFNREEFNTYLFSEFEDYNNLQEELKTNPKMKLSKEEKALKNYPPRPANQTLLMETVMKSSPPDMIEYHLVKPEDKIEKLWTQSINTYSIQIECRNEFYRYDESGHCYIDFAHATTFGGAYRTFGCVQEERMFSEFPSLAFLDFMTKDAGGVHPCVDKDGGHSGYPPHTEPQPFIIEGVKAEYNLDKVTYGSSFHDLSKDKIEAGVEKIDSPFVDILGLAAMDWRGIAPENRIYTEDQLKYMFGAAYLGFEGANQLAITRGHEPTTIHTAPWGCGAFENSFNTILFIQLLAAKMAGVDLIFHAVKDGTPFSRGSIEAINKEVDQFIFLGRTPQDMVDFINFKQTNEGKEHWLPQKSTL